MATNKLIPGFVVWILLTSTLIQTESLEQFIDGPDSKLRNVTKEPVVDSNTSKPMPVGLVGSTTLHSMPSSSFEDNFDSISESEEVPRIIYDQRQSGRYNVHIVIKDVAIFEMDRNKVEDYIGNDYYYDEADLTVKPLPLHQLTTSPSSATVTASTTEASNNTLKTNSTQKPLVSSVDVKAVRSSNKPESIYVFHPMDKNHNAQVARSNLRNFKHEMPHSNHRTSSLASHKRQSEGTPSVLKRMQQQHVYHQRRCRNEENCHSSSSIKTSRRFSSGKALLNRLLLSLIKLPFYQDQENIDKQESDHN